MKSTIQVCFAIVAVLVQIFSLSLADVKLKIKKPIVGQAECAKKTVIFTAPNNIVITLFADKTDSETIKRLIPLVISRIAQQVVFNDYPASDPFGPICSQMYYQLGSTFTYSTLFENQQITDPSFKTRLDKAYQDASDSAFAGENVDEETVNFENALNKNAFSSTKTDDYRNLFNGKFDGKFFEIFSGAVTSTPGSEQVKGAFNSAFVLEKASFNKINQHIIDFMAKLRAEVSNV